MLTICTTPQRDTVTKEPIVLLMESHQYMYHVRGNSNNVLFVDYLRYNERRSTLYNNKCTC